MKKYFIVLAVILCVSAFNSQVLGQTTVKDNATVAKDTPSMTLDELLSDADSHVDKQVKVKGYVTHICKHAGKRCFLVGESQQQTVRVEAKGKIGGFNRELTGSEIEVNGVLHERRLTSEMLDAMEIQIEEKRLKVDGSAESCDAENANVSKMRAKMNERGKDYFSIYYIDGEDYTEI